MSANGTRITPGSVRVQVSTCLALCGCLLLALGAQSAQTRYEYDALGRVSSATFSDDSQLLINTTPPATAPKSSEKPTCNFLDGRDRYDFQH